MIRVHDYKKIHLHKRAEKAQDDKEAAIGNERAAKNESATIGASERSKTECEKMRLEAKTILQLDNKSKRK